MLHSTPRPNVLWLMCDQLRWQALSRNGDPNVRTPTLDRLAADGCAFDLAVSQYPICTPFRAGLITGQYAHVNGVRVHGDVLPTDRRTIAHAFNDAGYRTGWVGKWHLASVQSPLGCKAGADYWVHPLMRGGFGDWLGFDCSNHFYKTRYSRGDQIWPPEELEGYQTDALTDLFLNHMEQVEADCRNDPRPWFQVISWETPHPACDEDDVYRNPAPREYETRFDPEQLILRPNVPAETEAKARSMLAGYYAQIENLDDNVARVLAWLEASGRAEDTVVCFFSDHGELGGSHGVFEKNQVWDEALRIPMVVRYPRTVTPGRVVTSPFSGLDLFPTCCGLAGVPIPAAVQGIDASSLACGEPSPTRSAALVQWLGPALHGFSDYQFRAIRTDTHLYAVNTDARWCLLFDTSADPYQRRNLFGLPEASDVQRALHRRLCAEVVRSGEVVPAFVSSAGLSENG